MHQRSTESKPLDVTHFKFENRSRTTFSDSSNHSLYLMKLLGSSCLEGNCGGNQLRDGSVCLSPLSPSITNNLNVSIATRLHQSFPKLCPSQASFTIFQVLTLLSCSNHFQDHGMYTYTDTHIYIYIYINIQVIMNHQEHNRRWKEKEVRVCCVTWFCVVLSLCLFLFFFLSPLPFLSL